MLLPVSLALFLQFFVVGALGGKHLCNLQLWVASDYDHRLKSNDVLNILKLAEKHLGISNMEVEVEYQQNTIGRFELTLNGDVFQLVNTQTNCLAPDQCGVSLEKPRARFSSGDLSCNPNSNCC